MSNKAYLREWKRKHPDYNKQWMRKYRKQRDWAKAWHGDKKNWAMILGIHVRWKWVPA